MIAVYFVAGLVAAIGSMVVGAWLFRAGQKFLIEQISMTFPSHEELMEASRDAMAYSLSQNDGDEEEY